MKTTAQTKSTICVTADEAGEQAAIVIDATEFLLRTANRLPPDVAGLDKWITSAADYLILLTARYPDSGKAMPLVVNELRIQLAVAEVRKEKLSKVATEKSSLASSAPLPAGGELTGTTLMAIKQHDDAIKEIDGAIKQYEMELRSPRLAGVRAHELRERLAALRTRLIDLIAKKSGIRAAALGFKVAAGK